MAPVHSPLASKQSLFLATTGMSVPPSAWLDTASWVHANTIKALAADD